MTESQRQYGDCYESSLTNAEELQVIKVSVETGAPNASLFTEIYEGLGLSAEIYVVHGTVVPPIGQDRGRTIMHAWIEIGEGVVETSNGQQEAFPRLSFYETYGARPAVRYTVAHARELAIAHAKYDAWHLLPRKDSDSPSPRDVGC